jgi:hypothetical protein
VNRTFCANYTVATDVQNITTNETVEPVAEPEPEPYVEPPDTNSYFRQQYLRYNSTVPDFYLLFKSNDIQTYRGFIGSMLTCALMGFACELMRFLKWYIAIRRRVTENSLQQMLGEIEHMTNEQDRQL